jgi:5-methylcytosine-specific restriction endonuclease McrA
MSRSRIPKALRARVAAQALYRCGYCLTSERIVGTPMELDHLIPEALGGATEEENLWLACSLCNDAKGSRIAWEDPSSGDVVRLFNPRHQDWAGTFSMVG